MPDMLNEIEVQQAARAYDIEHIEKLRRYLMKADQGSELDMIGKGKTVCEWAINYMERLNA